MTYADSNVARLRVDLAAAVTARMIADELSWRRTAASTGVCVGTVARVRLGNADSKDLTLTTAVRFARLAGYELVLVPLDDRPEPGPEVPA